MCPVYVRGSLPTCKNVLFLPTWVRIIYMNAYKLKNIYITYISIYIEYNILVNFRTNVLIISAVSWHKFIMLEFSNIHSVETQEVET